MFRIRGAFRIFLREGTPNFDVFQSVFFSAELAYFEANRGTKTTLESAGACSFEEFSKIDIL